MQGGPKDLFVCLNKSMTTVEMRWPVLTYFPGEPNLTEQKFYVNNAWRGVHIGSGDYMRGEGVQGLGITVGILLERLRDFITIKLKIREH